MSKKKLQPITITLSPPIPLRMPNLFESGIAEEGPRWDERRNPQECKRPFKEQPKQIIKDLCKKNRYNPDKFLKILQEHPVEIREYIFNHIKYKNRKESLKKRNCTCEEPQLRIVSFNDKKFNQFYREREIVNHRPIKYVRCTRCGHTYRMTSYEACARAVALNPEIFPWAVPRKYRCQELELIAKCG